MTIESVSNQPEGPLLRLLVGGQTRKNIFENYIIYSEFGTLISAIILFIAVHYGEKTTSPLILGPGLIVIAWNVSGKFFKAHMDRYEKIQKKKIDQETDQIISDLRASHELALSQAQESFEIGKNEGLEEGADLFFRLWADVARRHEDGMDNANRQLEAGMAFNLNEHGNTEITDCP